MLFYTPSLIAQPSNNNCSNASIITLSNGGYGYGTFTSTPDDITKATVQTGENFAPAILVAGQTQKSIWYKFTLPTIRSVRVTLAQPGVAIAAGDAGFAIYKANACLPGDTSLSTKLTPIATFGNTYHPCVDPGDYYVQVSSNNKANGPLYIQVTTTDSSGALYDHPNNAYKFGKLSSFVTNVDYLVQCQSIEDGNEVCSALSNYNQYTKSTWHTFTTPVYFDYLSVMLAGNDAANNNGYFIGNTTNKFGYTLYEGDVTTTPYTSLTAITSCDSLMSNGYQPDYKIYKCSQLKPNTTYTIQLFFNKNFNENIRVAIAYGGTKPTQAPEPILSKLPASNKFGTLVSGTTHTLTDYSACNSLHSLHPCNPSLPSNGLKYSGTNYNLSSFFTFNLTFTARVDINMRNYGCSQYYLRLYKQDISENCASLDTSNLIGQFTSSGAVFFCSSPGIYTIQVIGTDSIKPKNSFNYGSLLSSTSQLCLLSSLGQQFDLYVLAQNQKTINKFSLNIPGAFDSIGAINGNMQPLQNGVTYNAAPDSFGCQNTVLPADKNCSSNFTKTVYRQLLIGDANNDAVPDSGVLRMSDYSIYPYSPPYPSNRLYRGNANDLAIQQNAWSYPDTIKALTPYSPCFVTYGSENACIVPGTYTFTTVADDRHIGVRSFPNFTFKIVNTAHYSPPTAQNLGDITPVGNSGVVTSDVDYFSCKDNAITINGYQPCLINNKVGTKAIYRQFYLGQPANISITLVNVGSNLGTMTLFNGKATDGEAGLIPTSYRCFSNQLNIGGNCSFLPAGWYTIVSYGTGPNYIDPLKNVESNYYLGALNQYEIGVTKVNCPAPKYNRPYKGAIDTITKQPYLVQWKNRVGSTAAYPYTDTTYTLYTENFNCTVDTPFSSHPIKSCNTSLNRVAYYVFKTTQESYVQIKTQNYWAQVLEGDVRKDSTSFATATPIQPCVQEDGYIQICRLQPGTYTLAVFAGDNNSCYNVTPTIYIDQVGYSRFDHAITAYDFGLMPADSAYHNGKVGDVNPLNATRAASNDFFYCTTGSQITDPVDGDCYSYYNPNIYKAGANLMLYNDSLAKAVVGRIARRNIWYTFVVDKGGWVYVRVNNKTIGKGTQYSFAVYKSDVDGNLSFNQVKSIGLVDSTLTQGLSYIKRNRADNSGVCYDGAREVSFYRDPCNTFAERYYVLVVNPNSYPNDIPGMNPNSQVEVEVMVDSINAIPPKFDHYFQASDMGKLGAGKYKGVTDNYSCATSDVKDPIYSYAYACAKKTLWYKFTSTVTGHVRFQITINGVTKEYRWTDVHLLRETTQGDSTNKGLQILNTGDASYYDNTTDSYWGQQCISPGTYYLLLTGCRKLNEYVYPEIQIFEEAGDFCNVPVVASLNGPGSKIASVIIDCHTIGTDYGEFNPLLTCPANAKKEDYKSSWFRIDVTGKDTLDVTAFLNQKTTALSSDIKYRLMTGDCSAMQEQSCVQDALTQNTYKCLAPGNYFMQVFTPVTKNGRQVTGTIDLNLKAVVHADTCAPIKKCLVNANFTPQFDCKTDSAVRFVNYSTYGSSVINKWDFGYAGQTSTAVSPTYTYPAIAKDTTYTVKLYIQNTTCGERDSVIRQVVIPGRPLIRLPGDTSICTAGSTLTLNATSFTGATYEWQDGSTNSTYKATAIGQQQYFVAVAYNNCISNDTINIYINPIAKNTLKNHVICNLSDSIHLSDYRGYAETYLWNNGKTDYQIYVKDAGIYWVDLSKNGCTVRDSFNVAKVADLHPLGNDTTICQAALPYTVDATINGASSYTWQDNATSPQYTITRPGTYWVDVKVSSCNFRDSLTLNVDKAKSIMSNARICAGRIYTLPSGRTVNTSGIYKDTLRNRNGCDSIETTLNLKVDTAKIISINTSICTGQTYKLPSGVIVNSAGTYMDTVRSLPGCDSLITTVNLKVNSPTGITVSPSICPGGTYTLPSGKIVNKTGVYIDTLKSTFGCDSLIITVNLTVKTVSTINTNATICLGQAYKLPSGLIVSVAGIYKDTLHDATGCDSMITIANLKINSPTEITTQATICGGQSYTLPSGTIVKSSGVYKDTLKNMAGCDSIITTTNLKIIIPAAVSRNVSICKGQSYTLPSGVIVGNTGIYKDTLKSVAGCDSLITTVNLSLLAATLVNSNVSICFGQSYTLSSGKIAYSAGVYKDTLKTVAGCDSLITTVNLSVFTASLVNMSRSICKGQSYTMPSGTIVYASGVYKDTLRTVAGCDSLITKVTLTVLNPSLPSIDTSVCSGQSYSLPSGKIVNNAGTYIDTLKSTAGCDSLITTINLTIYSPAFSNTNASICLGQSYTLPSGKIINAAGIYKDTLKNKAGCDSLITTVNLSISTLAFLSKNASICLGQDYTLPSGKIINSPGIYKDTVKYMGGCDSLIATVNLAVFSPTFISRSASVCSGRSFALPSGAIVNTAGIYKDTIKNIFGCDSLITTVSLSILSPTLASTNVSVCFGQGYTLPSGKMVNIAGVYKDTLKTMAGCDSLITMINLSISSSTLFSTNASICFGQSFTLPSGKMVNTAGVYKDTLKSIAGCDSLIATITLSVFTPALKNKSATICAGQFYTMPSGNHINTSGVYKDTLRSAAGCDSLIIIVKLRVFAPELASTKASICPGQSYTLPSGMVVNPAGVYMDTVRSIITGCDSLITTVNLIVNTTSSSNVLAAICAGQTYKLPSGQVVNTSGVYISTIKNSNGCDSVITTTVKYYPPLYVKLLGPASICKGDQALLSAQASGGNGGPYIYAWSASVDNINQLVITPVANTKVIVSIGDGCTLSPAKDSIIVTVNTKPIPGFSILPGDGCVPLIVVFTNSTSPSLNNLYTWNFGDLKKDTQISPSHTYVKPGSYTVSLVATNTYGCSDSVKIINAVKALLTPVAAFKTFPFPNTIANSKIEFTDMSTDATSWLWIFGDGIGSSVQHDPTYIYKDAGTYTAMLIAANYNNCTDTSYAKIVIQGGKDIYIPNSFTPNGDGINDNFRVYGIGLQSVDMAIYDRWGEKVFEQKANPPVWNGNNQKYGTNCDPGAFLYVIKTVDKNGKVHSFTGTVILIR